MIINAEWYFWSHRLSLAKSLRDHGCEVIVAAAVERGYRSAIEREGFRFIPLHLRRRSINPFWELLSVYQLFRLYCRERPHLVHHFTIKPILYGSFAAKAAGVPFIINTVPGLGYIFLRSGLRGIVQRQMVTFFYWLALLGKQVRLIVQNPDDLREFISKKLVSPNRVTLIRGSGVNVHHFVPSPEPADPPMILLASRLLWDKGVGDLVEASRRLKEEGISCRVIIVGLPDHKNPNSIPESKLKSWQKEGLIEWWGLCEDMATVLNQSNIVVLPTYYREGVPKILLEAAAAGRPIITTDAPGCREVVRPGENGILVPPKDALALANAIRTLVLDPVLRKRMGARSREIAVTEFSEEQVNKETLAIYRDLLKQKWPEQNISREL